MSLPPETEAEILRLFLAEGWKVGTLARQFRVHRDVIELILSQHEALSASSSASRATMIDPYRTIVIETWKRYPKLSATGLSAG